MFGAHQKQVGTEGSWLWWLLGMEAKPRNRPGEWERWAWQGWVRGHREEVALAHSTPTFPAPLPILAARLGLSLGTPGLVLCPGQPCFPTLSPY